LLDGRPPAPAAQPPEPTGAQPLAALQLAFIVG